MSGASIEGKSSPFGAAGIFHWWTGELARLWQEFAGARGGWRLLLLKDAQGIEIFRRSGGEIEPLGRISAASSAADIAAIKARLARMSVHSARIKLRLSDSVTLRKTLSLPRAALDVVEPVIANQIDRLTPWSPDQTVYGHAIATAAAGGQDVEVGVVSTSRDLIDAARVEAKEIGLDPGQFDFGPTAQEAGIPISNYTSRHNDKPRRTIAALLVAILLGAIGIGGVESIYWFDAAATRDALALQIDEAKTRWSLLQRLEREIAELDRQRSALIERKTSESPLVLVLDGLSETLPDNAWLQGLEVAGGNIQLTGVAANAATLIPLLERSGRFTAVGFSAPTTRGVGSVADVFSIKATALVTGKKP